MRQHHLHYKPNRLYLEVITGILTEKRQIYSRTFDTRPCLDATLDDLEIDLFKNEYLPKAVSPEVLKQDKRSIEQQLASLRLYDKHFHCPTNAGILLLGTDPKYYIFGSYIQYVRFSGLNRASKVVKENTFSGNLIRMLKELDSFVKYTIENRRPEFVSALREKTAIDYPYLAVRELLMNAVMHRSYEGSNAPVKFYEYSNRIEIDNPGNLFGKARIENFPHENDYRNPVLAEAMKTLGYVNQFGRGISMVQETLQENGNSPAEFILNDISTFKVVLYTAYANAEENTGNQHRTKHVSGDVSGDVSGESNRINARQDQILALMNQDKYISVSTIARHIGCSARTIYRDIDCLKPKSVIRLWVDCPLVSCSMLLA